MPKLVSLFLKVNKQKKKIYGCYVEQDFMNLKIVYLYNLTFILFLILLEKKVVVWFHQPERANKKQMIREI